MLRNNISNEWQGKESVIGMQLDYREGKKQNLLCINNMNKVIFFLYYENVSNVFHFCYKYLRPNIFC